MAINMQKKGDKEMSSLKQKIQESIELLSEVIAKRGAYSQDHLQHAENVMENASEKARKVTKNLEEIAGLLDEATKEIADLLDEATKELLNLAIHGLKEAQNGESSDCASTFATIIEKLGIHVEYDEWHEPIIDAKQVKAVLEGAEWE